MPVPAQIMHSSAPLRSISGPPCFPSFFIECPSCLAWAYTLITEGDSMDVCFIPLRTIAP